MILLEDILEVHHFSIEKYGGATGIRDENSLQSAIARPFHNFGGEDLYKNVFEKAAALGESLICNHPFIDGNKRTGLLAMVALIESYGYTFSSSQQDAYNFTIAIASGKATFDEIVNWLKANTTAV